jgi:hypothetical protein
MQGVPLTSISFMHVADNVVIFNLHKDTVGSGVPLQIQTDRRCTDRVSQAQEECSYVGKLCAARSGTLA